ncbi:putative cytochrome P450 superfamily protein isoform X4 [Iris pallida]|uniref:Cytochrome P450 superfamily protein isoform X4 n=1 Tax=Iris pallida TaxID=29817 RepID=A0AAX6GN01_IRIPA|nr:putative cytochrome P450 superfamily protein isoform X4 [Iris pallida]KAJ6829899.1 putative cytochrome P450 superfamily protein isoform X4 [Iris pallida]
MRRRSRLLAGPESSDVGIGPARGSPGFCGADLQSEGTSTSRQGDAADLAESGPGRRVLVVDSGSRASLEAWSALLSSARGSSTLGGRRRSVASALHWSLEVGGDCRTMLTRGRGLAAAKLDLPGVEHGGDPRWGYGLDG